MGTPSTDASGGRIRTSDGAALPALTKTSLGALLDGHAAPGCPILDLTRDDLHAIRASLLPDGVYELEHRRGSATERFQLYTTDPVLVRDVLWAWISDDPWWYQAVGWYRVDPAIAELRAVQDELAGMLDGLGVMDDLTASMDATLARADELLADIPEPDAPDQD